MKFYAAFTTPSYSSPTVLTIGEGWITLGQSMMPNWIIRVVLLNLHSCCTFVHLLTFCHGTICAVTMSGLTFPFLPTSGLIYT